MIGQSLFSKLESWLSVRTARLASAKLTERALQSHARRNPTCRILSASISEVTFGENVTILSGTVLNRVSVSDFSYVSNGARISNASIGKFSSIGPDVLIGLAPHPSRVFVSTSPVFYSLGNPGCSMTFQRISNFDDSVSQTVIGNDVWIGANAIIPGGIDIGTGAIVAAGAVVVNSVPPYAIVGGNPAQIIRYRFSEVQIKFLLESEWWNWSLKEFFLRVDDFSDIEKFMAQQASSANTKS